MKIEGWSWLAVILCLLVVVWVGFAIAPQEPAGFSQADVDQQVETAVTQATDVKNAEIKRLTGLLQNETVTPEPEEVGYLLDELFLDTALDEDTYSDREISTLFDGEISFDGDDYDAEETILLKDIVLKANENDFKGEVYMTVLEGAIEYKLTFESDLNTSLIDDDDTLEFNFLGEAYEISAWDVDEVTLSKGSEYKFDLLNGQSSYVIDGKTVKVDYISDDEVGVDVDGISKEIDEDQTKTVNGLEIKVKSCSESDHHSKAVLVIAEEVEVSLDSGDEYEDDSPWEWVIDANFIGLILSENFDEVDLDGDEEFSAVSVDGQICLPNEYVCVKFNGMAEEDSEEYAFELDDKDGPKVRVDGNFVSALEDYDRVYINASGIYDRDLELIDSSEIELGNTESVLILEEHENATTRYIEIGDFAVEFTLDDAGVWDGSEWVDINSEEDDYLSGYGIKILNPEDAADDEEYTILIPEEKLEGSITLI